MIQASTKNNSAMMVEQYRTFQPRNLPSASWKDTNPSTAVPRYQPPPLEAPYGLPTLSTYKSSNHRRQRSTSSSVSMPNNIFGNSQPGHTLNRRSGSTSTKRSSISTGSASQQYTHVAYVATLRKQKATVWCDHTQQEEDPRIVHAVKAAKMKALEEVSSGSSPLLYGSGNINNHGVGGSSSASPASSLYGGGSDHQKSPSLTLASSKIRAVSVGVSGTKTMKKVWKSGSHGHGGKVVMNPGTLIVGGLPARLSASEVQGDSEDDDEDGFYFNGTRRPSLNERSHSLHSRHKKGFREYKGNGLQHSNSTGSKSSTESGYSPDASSIAEVSETPMTIVPPSHLSSRRASPKSTADVATIALLKSKIIPKSAAGGDYFFPLETTPSSHPPPIPRKASTRPQISRNSSNSYSRGNEVLVGIEKVRTPMSELRRRGSVDEREARTRTMSGVRLFVANPDQ